MQPAEMNQALQVDRRFRVLLAVVVAAAVGFTVMPPGLEWGNEREIDVTGGSIVKRLQWLPLYLSAMYVIWVRRTVVLVLYPYVNPFIVPFIIWAAITLIWSPEQAKGVRRLVILVGAVVIAYSFQLAAWRHNRLQRVVRITLSALMLASILMVFLMPSIGVDRGGNLWRGVTLQKNHLGQLASVGMLVWTHAMLARDARIGVCTAWILLSLVLVIGAGSTTGILTAVGSMFLLIALFRPPVRDPFGLTLILLGVFVLFALPLHFYMLIFGIPTFAEFAGPIFELFGKNVTLTGRDVIWDIMSAEIAKHPMQGIGYGSFWTGPDGPSGYVRDILFFTIWQAHNGYLDIINETGFIGFAISMLFMIYHAITLGRLASIDRVDFAFHTSFFVLFIAVNFSESAFFWGDQFLFLILLLSSLTMSRTLAAVAQVRQQEAAKSFSMAPNQS